MALAQHKADSRYLSLPSGRRLDLTLTPVMGILNVTPDSFSDGGRFLESAGAIERGLRMQEDGASVVDVGGESTRPGAEAISPETEMERVIPVIEGIRKHSDIPISIDTYREATARAALDVGADIVNDISALRFDSDMAGLIAARQAPVILMHMLGIPRTMQQDPRYRDCVGEICDFFDERLRFCQEAGIERRQIILDPGVGFGKRLQDNIDILSRFAEFGRFDLPLLIGTSRKSFINMLHPRETSADARLGGSLASMAVAVINNAAMVRAHDVAETVEAVKVLRAVKENL